ncbi:MAG: hypothetical protein ACI9SE_002674 [Neolewinella sp.]|jgi:hypothetical protein
MIIGQTIQGDSRNNITFFTPWFSRAEDNAVFGYERIWSTLGTAETVKVFHKLTEDPGTGTVPTSGGTFAQLGSTGVFQAEPSDLKELVRFQITLFTTTGWLHFRFLEPNWFSAARV